tara:strand:+ start:853 stop:1377 length:525 start_codon:yes stop_codon:yes gene_type:complete
MEQDNVIKELPEPVVGGSIDTKENIIPKDFSDKNIAIVLSIMSIVGFFYDVLISDVKTCLNQTETTKNKIFILLITFFHHFLATFGLFGWMFNNKKLLILYISIIVVTIVQWKFNNGDCLVTKQVAILSNNKEYKRFNDFYRIIGLKKIIPPKILYYGSLSIFVLIALYKIFFT